VSSRAGVLVVGPGPGRGAWLCAGSTACFDQAVRGGRLARALREALSDGALADLRRELFG
jgi:predicted RNA-binding protein YlxR (DUF448 family)